MNFNLKNIFKNKKKIVKQYKFPLEYYSRISLLYIFFLILLNFIVLPSLKEIFMLLYPLTLINFIIDLFFSCALIGIIYFDIDCISAILKRQYLEVTNEYVKVKSLFRTKIINWTDVEIVGEMESYPNNILFGIIVWKYGEEGLKSILYGNSLVIDFNKYSQLDKYEFCDAMQRKRRNSYRKRF